MNKDLALLLIDRANIIEEVVATSLDFDRAISTPRLESEDSIKISKFAKYTVGVRSVPTAARNILSNIAESARDAAEDFSEPFETFDRAWGFGDIINII